MKSALVFSLWIVLSPLFGAPEGMRKYRSKEAILKSNAPAKAAKALGKRIDYYCRLFQEFYDEIGLDKKNDNTLKLRVFNTYDEYEEYYKRSGAGLGGTPLAYFSRSLNSIVMYRDDEDVALRAVVFHECSHQFLNRYTYDAPKWLNEGLAEYFEGWKVTHGVSGERRPHLYDLTLVQKALETGEFLEPRQMIEMDAETFVDFQENYPDLHGYLHYATSWSIVYHCLHSEGEDRELLVRYLEDLTKKGASAKFEVEDWSGFTKRWKDTVLGLKPTALDATDHFLLGSGARSNRKWAKAIQSYETALEVDPELPGVHYWLGYCHKRLGNYPKAIEYLGSALEDDPEDPRVPYYLSRIYLGIDNEQALPQIDKATAYAEAASDLVDHSSPLYMWLLAKCQLAGGDKSRAKRTAKKILKLVDREDRDTWEPLVEEIRKAAK
ncbi:MAG: hypothetical protein CMJ89_02005 [Planctomycetes bacterium]|jgi:tetratricopeptide (TPR) repeat protein|nr:hypothetical protein [Planctomycetota bacterium]